MIMTNRLSRGFPDMLLRIEFGRGWRQPKDLKPRVILQEGFDQLAAMPRGTVPQEQDRLGGIGRQEHEQKEDRGRPIHQRGTHDGLLPGLQVERTIEMGRITVRRDMNDRCLSAGVPDAHRCRLKVKRGFIPGHDHGRWRRLGRVDEFFSSASSNAITRCSLRDK